MWRKTEAGVELAGVHVMGSMEPRGLRAVGTEGGEAREDRRKRVLCSGS